MHAGVYPDPCTSFNTLDLHEMSSGAAVMATSIWLDSLASKVKMNPNVALEGSGPFTVITGWGKHSSTKGSSAVKDAIASLLHSLNSPFEQLASNPGRFTATHKKVCTWMLTSYTSVLTRMER